MTFAVKSCVTCSKPCYPTERIRVSDVWVHKHCLKCCECHTTLSLNSVYLAPAAVPVPSTAPVSGAAPLKLLYCGKDVPKVVHTSIVDSVALKTAMKAPKSTTVPTGVMDSKVKGKGKTIRFKGLTLRSKSIAAGLSAPRLDIPGQMRSKVIVGQVGSVGLDSWDISHAMNVQSQVSAPIRSHPAIHAQRTGTSAGQWPMPSQPLEPQYTGQSVDDVLSASKGEAGVRVETDLVKNLIKVFQLDVVEQVEILSEPEAKLLTPDYTGSTESESISQDTWTGTLKPSTFTSVRSSAAATVRTLRTLAASPAGGGRKGTLTLARIKGNLRRPALSELFDHDNHIAFEEGGRLTSPTVPQNTPAKGSSRDTVRASGTLRGTGESGTVRADKLLEAFLPLAAHLVPLPIGEDGDLDENDASDADDDDGGFAKAQQQLAEDLEYEGLELVMLFEEEPISACEA